MSQNQEYIKLGKLNETQTQTILSNLLPELDSTVLSDLGEVNGEFLLSLTEKDLEDELKIESEEGRSNFFHQLEEYKRNGVPITGDKIETEQIQLEACKQNKQQEMLIHLLVESKDVATQNTCRKKIKLLHLENIKLSNAKPDIDRVKQIIFLGETGSGKSSLINSIVNVMVGMEQERDFRFKVIENEIQTGNSSTNSIQGYKLESEYSSYTYILWDTPGFFHTSGFECDIQLAHEFSYLLSAIKRVDAIVIVEKASDILKTGCNEKSKLQKEYLFNQMLSNFGDDALPHTYLFLTFPSYWDEQIPDLSQYSFPFKRDQAYVINNSVMFEKRPTNTEMSKKVWGKNVFSIRHFIDRIHSNGSLDLKCATLAILQCKTELELKCWEFVKLLKRIQINQKEFEKLEEKLKQNKEKLEKNKDYHYNVKELDKVPVPTKRNTVYCTKCIHTCHADCIEMGKPKPDHKKCEAFDKGGNCQMCPLRCPGKYHTNHPYIMEEQEVTKQKVDEKMKQTFEKTKENIEKIQKKIHTYDVEYQKLTEEGLNFLEILISSLVNVINQVPYYSLTSTFDYLKQLKEQNQTIQKLFSGKITEQFTLHHVIQTVYENKSKVVMTGEHKTQLNTLLETLKAELEALDKEFGGEMI